VNKGKQNDISLLASTTLKNVVGRLWEYDQSNQENCGNASNSQFSGIISQQDKHFIQSNIIQAVDQCTDRQVR